MKASILKKLREQRLKITPQRTAIIEAFLDNISLHPGARLIYEQARKKVKSLSLSTVYATLTELSKHGIIKMLEFDKMENRYEGDITAAQGEEFRKKTTSFPGKDGGSKK